MHSKEGLLGRAQAQQPSEQSVSRALYERDHRPSAVCTGQAQSAGQALLATEWQMIQGVRCSSMAELSSIVGSCIAVQQRDGVELH